MKDFKKGLLVVASLSFALGISACNKEGPMEKAGKDIDKAVEHAGEKIKDATNELPPKEGAVENAGKKIDNAVSEAGQKIESATETAKEKMQTAADKTGDKLKEAGDAIKEKTQN